MKPSMKSTTLIAAAGAILLLVSPMRAFTQDKGNVQESSGVSLQSIQGSFREVAKKVTPVVVEIDVTQVITQQAPQNNTPFDFPFGQSPQGGSKPRTFRQSGLGSGIIVQHTGDRYYVLTNNHVVKDATEVSVRLSDRRVFKATVVGTDPRKDIALVSFQSSERLPVAELGDSNALQVGDLVLAVGNPFGFDSTVTMGIVSALGRHGPQGDVATYTDYIQTDAAINQGNSGGALVNISGQVVGINTWIAAPTGGSIGLGFAIPINNARQAVQDFITKGKVEYGWLGAEIADVQGSDAAAAIARDLKIEGASGALLQEIFKDSPADKAGLLPGDYVTRVDAQETPNAEALTQAVGRLTAGRTYSFTLIRYGQTMTVLVKIGVRDSKDAVAQGSKLWPGMTVVPVIDQLRKDLNLPRGAEGVVVGSLTAEKAPAAIAGLRQGDLITGINGRTVRGMMDYFKALNDKANRNVNFQILREGTQISIGLER
jgi:Do/DeqQ family serine protease